jgi:hypothetical protein
LRECARVDENKYDAKTHREPQRHAESLAAYAESGDEIA